MLPNGTRSPLPDVKRINAASSGAAEKSIQIVTDGDNDLERYINEYFPEAEHTIDVYHVEYIWEAGHCLQRGQELVEWVEEQKEALSMGEQRRS